MPKKLQIVNKKICPGKSGAEKKQRLHSLVQLQHINNQVVTECSDLLVGVADDVGHTSLLLDDFLTGEVGPSVGNLLHVGDVSEHGVGHSAKLNAAALDAQGAAAQLKLCTQVPFRLIMQLQVISLLARL